MILSKEFILPNTTEIFDKVRKPIISSPSGCFIIYLFQGIKSSYCKRLLILALNIIPELKGRLLTVKNKNVLGLKLCSGHFCFCEKQQQQQQKKKEKKKVFWSRFDGVFLLGIEGDSCSSLVWEGSGLEKKEIEMPCFFLLSSFLS